MRIKRLLHCYIATLLIGFFLISYFLSPISYVFAECPSTDYDCQIAELQREYDARKDAQEKNKISLSEYEKQLVSLNKKLASIETNLKTLEKDIFEREVDLSFQEEVLAVRVRDYYINSRRFSPLLLFLSSASAQELTRQLAFRQQMTNQDRETIIKISAELAKLKSDKETLKKSRASLSTLKQKTGEQASFLRAEVSKTETFFAAIQAKQRDLLALKAGGFATSVGDVPPADDPASRPDYNPGFSPAFAAFSFGAPHFNGLSQYGAYGRAKDGGQNAETILRAYYGDVEIKKDYAQNVNICVGNSSSSCTNVPLETYAKRIYEMPGSWGDSGGMEALKAQAVAARSYALSSMARNGYICASESCQVYKPANKGGKWEEAVNATPGWVLMKNGKPLMAKYASTAGGYIDPYTDTFSGHTTPGFWDTPSGRSGWTSQAYEKTAESPWFYKAWYRVRSGGTCGGRNHPWLTSSDMADILNAWKVLFQGGGDAGRIFPPDNCGGGDPYSKSELQAIGGFMDVSDVSQVIYGDNGSTISVRLMTNKGEVTIGGEEFKKAFNLRAPGYIGLKSTLFNLMKK